MDYGNIIDEDDYNSWFQEKTDLYNKFKRKKITEEELLTELSSLCQTYFPINGYSDKDGEEVYLSIARREADKLKISPVNVLSNPRIISEFQVNSYLEDCFGNRGSLYSDENIDNRTSYSNTSYSDTYKKYASNYELTIKEADSEETAKEKIFLCCDSDTRGLSKQQVSDIFWFWASIYSNSDDASCVTTKIPMTYEQVKLTDILVNKVPDGMSADDMLYVIDTYKKSDYKNLSVEDACKVIKNALNSINAGDYSYTVEENIMSLYGCSEYHGMDETYSPENTIGCNPNLSAEHGLNINFKTEGSSIFNSFDIEFDPETGLYNVIVNMYHENENLKDETYLLYNILNQTSGFYDEEHYKEYQKYHLDDKVASMVDDMFSVNGIKYTSNVQTDDLAGFNVSANAYFYNESNDSGIYGYKDYAVYVSGDLSKQGTTLNNTLNNGIYTFNDFGFYTSVKIDQENSDLSKLGFKSVKTFSDKIYDSESDSYVDVNYYGVYLKNGQYCLIPRKDEYDINEVTTYVSNSNAMKNYKLYEALSNYYNNAEEVDVKYSSYTDKYSVYVNGNLIELNEQDAKYILSNGVSNSTVSKFNLPVTKSSEKLNGSAYVHNKFHRNCINLNDTATYDSFVKALRNDFSLSVKGARDSYNITDSLSPYMSSTGTVLSNKNSAIKSLNFLDKDSENLCLQIEKCISLLTMYDASLKSMLNTLIDNLFAESSLTKSGDNDFTSVLIDKDSDFMENFLDKEATIAYESYLALEAYKDGCIVLSKADLEKYSNYIDINKAEILNGENNECDTYRIPIDSIKNVGDAYEWAIEAEMSGKSNSLTNAINLSYSSISSVDGLNTLLSQSEAYKNYYTYTKEFAKDIFSDSFTNNLNYLNDSGISSDYFSNSELALFLCKSGLSVNKLESIINDTNKSTDFDTKDAIVNFFSIGALDANLNNVKNKFNSSQLDLLNMITNNSLDERIGYVSALKVSDFLLDADDSTLEKIGKGVSALDLGFDNGLLSVPVGLWHLYDPSLTSKEYFMSYIKDFLNPVDQKTLDNSYKNGTMSLKEYNFRKTVIDDSMQDRSGTLRTVMNVGNDVGTVTGNTLLALASAACPALSPVISAIQVGSNAGYKAQAYYLQSGGTTSDAWKSRLYGVLNASASYFTSRLLCSAGSSYTRFDAHGNALFGKSSDNISSFFQNYAVQRGKQLGSGLVSDTLLMGIDYIFDTDITYKNSLVGSILSADNNYVGKYSNNFWLDYALSSGVDLCLDMVSDYTVSSFQKKFEAKRQGNHNLEELQDEDSGYWDRIHDSEKIADDDLVSEAAALAGYVLRPDGTISGENVPEGVKHLYSKVGNDIQSIFGNEDGTFTVVTKYGHKINCTAEGLYDVDSDVTASNKHIKDVYDYYGDSIKSISIKDGECTVVTKYGYKIKCSENGLDSQNLEFDINYANETHESMVKLIGDKLYSWVPDEKKGMALYNTLMEACSDSGITYDKLDQSLKVLDLMEHFYSSASNLVLENDSGQFNTYRTHGIVHVMDVMTQCLNTYDAFQCSGIETLPLESIVLSAVMHDTGMSGGKQVVITKKDGKFDINAHGEISSDDSIYRDAHSFNSARDILMQYDNLKAMGYNDLQIAEASLLTFAHSKSNSGLNPLTDHDAGWSYAIHVLDDSTGPDGVKISKLLEDSGKITLTDDVKKLKNEVKTANGRISDVDIQVYEFGDKTWLSSLEQSALVVRLGDALTNNDNAGQNQYRKDITFERTDYSKQHSVEEVMSNYGITVDSSLPKSEQYESSMKALISKKLSKVGSYEASDITYEVDGVDYNESQPFVLGENNQTYGLRVDGDCVDVVVTVKDSEIIPFCTLFAIDERYGEVSSFSDKPNEKIRLIIEIDEGSSNWDLYQAYADVCNKKDLVNVSIRKK